jgi:hypothetical protein
VTYQDWGGSDQNKKPLTDETGEVLVSILSMFGWIVSIVGIILTPFSLATLGSSDGFLAVTSSFSAVIFGVLMIAAAAVVKSTADTAKNTKKMLDIMRQ